MNNYHPVKYAPYKEEDGEFDVIYVNGVDRVNSDLGYEIENCVPCCYRCNSMKMDTSLNEFKDHITKVYNHSIKDKK